MATSPQHAHYDEAIQTIVPRLSEEFRVTRAEMRVAILIAQGHGARAVSRKLNLSYETVRNHLKSLLGKTGARRQSALAVLVVRMEHSRGSRSNFVPRQPLELES